MATRTMRVCDKCSATEPETPELAEGEPVVKELDGRLIQLDLCTECRKQWQAFEMQASTWAGFAPPEQNKDARPSRRPRSKAEGDAVVRSENGAIRDWARSVGIPMPDRGRIPNEIREGFRAAQLAQNGQHTEPPGPPPQTSGVSSN